MKKIIDYALCFVGVPYKWGGSTHDGIDPEGARTAQSIYDLYAPAAAVTPKPASGVLCFYGKDVKSITHIALMIDDNRIIEAGGGGSHTLSREDAERDMAFVRIRPYNRRKDLVAMLMPPYPDWVKNES
jgi:cell wall-associated NlpC family hydrolase